MTPLCLRRFPCLLLISSLAIAEPHSPTREENLAIVDQWHQQNIRNAESHAHLDTRPGILINHRQRLIQFKAEAIGLGPREVIEFFLIGTRSGHAYESLAFALADPVHIAEALEQIGLPRGRPVDYSALRFWPEGERVHLLFDGLRVEKLLLNARTGQTMDLDGLVFTGSIMIPHESTLALAAQVASPFAIAANYNEPRAILDVPRQAPQSAVYSSLILNPEYLYPQGQLIDITIKPEYPDGKRRVQHMQIMVTPPTVESPSPTNRPPLVFDLTPPSPPPTGNIITNQTSASPGQLLAQLTHLIRQGHDPFVQIQFAPSLPLEHARQAVLLLTAIEKDDGIRLLPPPSGQLFHQALTPNEAVRERDDRFAHPWELRHQSGSQWTLFEFNETWQQGQLKPDYTVTPIPVTNGIAPHIPHMLEARPSVRGIFIYAPGTMTYGELKPIIEPLLPTHPNIHVFLTPSEPPPGQTSYAVPSTK